MLVWFFIFFCAPCVLSNEVTIIKGTQEIKLQINVNEILSNLRSILKKANSNEGAFIDDTNNCIDWRFKSDDWIIEKSTEKKVKVKSILNEENKIELVDSHRFNSTKLTVLKGLDEQVLEINLENSLYYLRQLLSGKCKYNGRNLEFIADDKIIKNMPGIQWRVLKRYADLKNINLAAPSSLSPISPDLFVGKDMEENTAISQKIFRVREPSNMVYIELINLLSQKANFIGTRTLRFSDNNLVINVGKRNGNDGKFEPLMLKDVVSTTAVVSPAFDNVVICENNTEIAISMKEINGKAFWFEIKSEYEKINDAYCRSGLCKIVDYFRKNHIKVSSVIDQYDNDNDVLKKKQIVTIKIVELESYTNVRYKRQSVNVNANAVKTGGTSKGSNATTKYGSIKDVKLSNITSMVTLNFFVFKTHELAKRLIGLEAIPLYT